MFIEKKPILTMDIYDFLVYEKRNNLYEQDTNMEIFYMILFQFKVFFVTLKENLIKNRKLMKQIIYLFSS
jgi:hypothetical protein